KLSQFEKYEFFKKDPSSSSTDVLVAMLQSIDLGKSIVLEFGKYDDLLVYMLVANVITRRLRDAYVEKTTRYHQTKQEADRPRQLMITIEEAHKFLSPDI